MHTDHSDGHLRCRWLAPTVFLDAPYWLDGEESPWSCVRDQTPRPLATTTECAVCLRFEPCELYSAVTRAERRDIGTL